MKNLCFVVWSFFVLLLSTSCGNDKSVDDNDDNTELEQIENSLNFLNPKAILLKSTSSLLKGSGNGDEGLFRLFQIDEKGVISEFLKEITVKSVLGFSKGVLIKLSNGNAYCLYVDNTFFKLPVDFDATYKGENENGDLIFSDLSVIRSNGFSVQKIASSLNNPSIQSMSGNFAIVRSETVFQIMNTVSGERFNVNDCNGPRMVALSKTKALIDDCQGKALIDMATGLRTESSESMWNHEHLYIPKKQAAVVLDQGAGIQDQNKYGLLFVFSNGISTSVCNEGFTPGGNSCMNCGEENKVLFYCNDFIVVKELTEISVVKLGDKSKKIILSGYNIISISVKDSNVYFIAEDRLGAKVTGIYKLLQDEIEILKTSDSFSKVFTLN